MGHAPLPPMPTSAEMFLAFQERRLLREMRGRTSLIGLTADPWATPRPKPLAPPLDPSNRYRRARSAA